MAATLPGRRPGAPRDHYGLPASDMLSVYSDVWCELEAMQSLHWSRFLSAAAQQLGVWTAAEPTTSTDGSPSPTAATAAAALDLYDPSCHTVVEQVLQQLLARREKHAPEVGRCRHVLCAARSKPAPILLLLLPNGCVRVARCVRSRVLLLCSDSLAMEGGSVPPPADALTTPVCAGALRHQHKTNTPHHCNHPHPTPPHRWIDQPHSCGLSWSATSQTAFLPC